MSITLKPLSTHESIKYWLSKDELYKQIFDIKDIKDFIPNTNRYIFFLVLEDSNEVGLLSIEQLFENCLCFHGGIYKEFRHKNSAKWLKESLDKLRQNLKFKFLTTIRLSNIAAIKLVTKLGFHKKTVIKNGYANDDLVLFSED